MSTNVNANANPKQNATINTVNSSIAFITSEVSTATTKSNIAHTISPRVSLKILILILVGK